MVFERQSLRELTRATLPRDLWERIQTLEIEDAGHGYNRFGLNRDWVAFAQLLMRPLYERWFRVTSHDPHHIPDAGRAILASNHSGTLPFDAMMVWTDVVRRSDPIRVPRSIADHFVQFLPWVNILFTRSGAVGGSRGNFEWLLEHDEMVLVFPEGVPGVGKNFSDRYQLQKWRVGHAEMALRHAAPVVPIAVIGAEEQMPQIGRLQAFKLFGSPYIPLTVTPLPLPVHYHIYYGAPIDLPRRYRREQADDPIAVAEAAAQIKAAVEDLVARGLRERPGVFK